jgi:hypothetical protein
VLIWRLCINIIASARLQYLDRSIAQAQAFFQRLAVHFIATEQTLIGAVAGRARHASQTSHVSLRRLDHFSILATIWHLTSALHSVQNESGHNRTVQADPGRTPYGSHLPVEEH